ncbi:MAG: hypothetical protein ACKORG_01960 [Actinomycetota bacterium]
MPRPAIRLALAAALVTATAACANAQTTKVALNPELVNPVVTSAAIVSGAISPYPDPSGMVPPPIVPDYWTVPSGAFPIAVTPPSAPVEIEIADVDLRMSILYVTDQAAKAILGGSTNMRNLPWLFRQEPSNSAGDAALGGNGTQRMWKISGSALAAKPTAAAMAAMLKAAVDRRCVTPAGVNTCGANLVGVDEIGASFGTAPGESDAGTPGALLKEAMTSLAKKEFSPGVSYANRVHFYLAPGVITSISAGLGPMRTLGANGKEMRRDYSQVMSAMSRAGGVWLEMYHYPERGKPRTPFTGAEWRDVPTRVATFLQDRTTGSRDPLNYMHFVLTDTPGAPPPAPEVCRAPVSSGASPNSVVADPDNILNPLPECPAAPPPPCPVLQPKVGSAGSTSREARETSILPGLLGPGSLGILNNAQSSLFSVVILRPISLAVLAPDDSGMTCQWKRAQGSTINTRILANGPAAFKVTGTEAEIFGQQFRQFFIVG